MNDEIPWLVAKGDDPELNAKHQKLLDYWQNEYWTKVMVYGYPPVKITWEEEIEPGTVR